MKNPRDIIMKPIITERSMADAEVKKFTFKVDKRANKIEIKNAVEVIFGVEVEKVTTMNMKGKLKRTGRFVGRRSDWKKAIVKLTPGSKGIQFFEGV
ncbi:50S ribosomal protein L23 [Acetobacterium bakii]|uniref:Large ribosomal subunit protein uL23 n=1 Tax=Acetobacterium bakii TaxID=52689 RepID=A0A0L6U2Q8_9FIRM|nr:50S ribosomal protein L23 [Acetobacterium bakii]KNZ42798.1 50S ribosomal protein L23 [Acetobacterium bakii]